jgi:hypothetical protein
MAMPQTPGHSYDPQGNQPTDQYQRDLNPNPTAGYNIGPEGERPGRFDRTADQIADLQTQMEDYSNDELNRIPVLKAGTRLEQGATYINLKDPARTEFTGMASDSVAAEDYIVPKSEVGYDLWNRLIGKGTAPSA